jgi:hypothetical protein
MRRDGQVVPQLLGGGVDAAEPLSELEGAFGLATVDQEPAGLPAGGPGRTSSRAAARWM